MSVPACALCAGDGGRLVLRAPRWRLVHAQEPGFPGFYRLVWNEHLPEMSDLPPDHRQECLEALVVIEQALREHLQPTKVNWAAFGNAVPHLHWHLIARYDWDSHFPGAFWSAPARPADPVRLHTLEARLPGLEDVLRQRFNHLSH